MPSQLSEILMSYRKALNESKGRFEGEYFKRTKKGCEFYNSFFKKLINEYSYLIKDDAGKRLLKKQIEQFFGSDEVRFAAIDGTLSKDQMGYYVVFFGASYGVRGTIKLAGEPPRIEYERWSMEQDKSMVAYVPVPYAELGDISEKDQFVSTDEDKIDLSNIHRLIMLLAEVYLAYDFVKTSSLRPRFLLWDQSITGILMHTDINIENIRLVGYRHFGRELRKEDLIVAYSHPYNEVLDIPSSKKVRIYNWVLRQLSDGKEHTVAELAEKAQIQESELRSRINNYLLKTGLIKEDSNKLILNPEFRDSWEYTKGLFEVLCERLFKNKDQSALIYEKEIDGETRARWMSPDDIRFLISVGLRALIELCWKYDVILVGIAKDSSTRYLTKNYLSVMRRLGIYDFEDIKLPWTDRMFLESLPYCDENIGSPWSTIEFDGAFSTIRYGINEKDTLGLIGIRGYITTQERIVAKSLAQFYINRAKANPRCGHVIFVDRLISPKIDKNNFGLVGIKNHEDMGNIYPIFFKDREQKNIGQDITMFLLHILTKNLYPEVIGYPDPLHKADWGAKSLLKKVNPIIKSSGKSLKMNPLNKTLRTIREERRRI